MSLADVHLPWFWGFAARNWAGEAGLRSPLGAQLEAVREGVHLEHGAADSWRAIEQADRRVSAARLARSIEARLARLTVVQCQALRLHYDPRATLPFEVDAAAVLLAASRALVDGTACDLPSLRKALLGASPAKREAVAKQASELVRVAREAYEAQGAAEEVHGG
jgi:hypothetical protein